MSTSRRVFVDLDGVPWSNMGGMWIMHKDAIITLEHLSYLGMVEL